MIPERQPERGPLAKVYRIFNQLRDHVLSLTPVAGANVRVQKTQRGFIIEADSGTTNITNPPGESIAIKKVCVASVSDDLLRVYNIEDDGITPILDTPSYADQPYPYAVAKPVNLRRTTTQNTPGTTPKYTWGSRAGVNNYQTRFLDWAISPKPYVEEKINPQYQGYVAGATQPLAYIWIAKVNDRTGVADPMILEGDGNVLWMDINIDARHWAPEYKYGLGICSDGINRYLTFRAGEVY